MAELPRRKKLTRLLLVAGSLLVAANLMILAGSQHDDAAPQLPSEIQQLFPNPQQVIRPQETVGADLRDDLQGQLYINGAPIPADEIVGDPNLGIVTFRPGCASSGPTTPGADCAFREFEPGTYSLRIDYWPRTESISEARRQADLGSYAWQIKVG